MRRSYTRSALFSVSVALFPRISGLPYHLSCTQQSMILWQTISVRAHVRRSDPYPGCPDPAARGADSGDPGGAAVVALAQMVAAVSGAWPGGAVPVQHPLCGGPADGSHRTLCGVDGRRAGGHTGAGHPGARAAAATKMLRNSAAIRPAPACWPGSVMRPGCSGVPSCPSSSAAAPGG